jgi:hypothetical protein
MDGFRITDNQQAVGAGLRIQTPHESFIAASVSKPLLIVDAGGEPAIQHTPLFRRPDRDKNRKELE